MSDFQKPRCGLFWFVAEPDLQPRPSRMAGYFSDVSEAQQTAPDVYVQCQLYRDEIWPSVAHAHPFVGFRDQSHYPGGRVSCRPDGTASYLIDPALNTPEFLDIIATQTGTTLARAEINVTDHRAPGRIGSPIAADYDANVPFTLQAIEPAAPTLGALIDDRAQGAMLGLTIGDALGVPLEFSCRDTLPHVSEMIGGGPFDLEPGEWTDDTSMALCLLDSLVAKRGYDGIDVLDRFVRWWENGENSVNGRCFDIGITTRAALERYKQLGTPAGNGPHDKKNAGNGSLMRLAPVTIFAAHDRPEAVRLAAQQSMLTHANQLAADACALFATMLVEAMCGASKDDVLRSRFWLGRTEVKGIAAGEWIGRRATRSHLRDT